MSNYKEGVIKNCWLFMKALSLSTAFMSRLINGSLSRGARSKSRSRGIFNAFLRAPDKAVIDEDGKGRVEGLPGFFKTLFRGVGLRGSWSVIISSAAFFIGESPIKGAGGGNCVRGFGVFLFRGDGSGRGVRESGLDVVLGLYCSDLFSFCK